MKAVIHTNRTKLSEFYAAIKQVEADKGAENIAPLVVPFRYAAHTGETFFAGIAPQLSRSAEAVINKDGDRYTVREYQVHAEYELAHQAIAATFDVFNAAQELAEKKRAASNKRLVPDDSIWDRIR